MTDQQILEAIQAMQSNTIQAMKEVVAPIHERLDAMDGRLNVVESQLTELRTEIKDVKAEVADVKAEVKEVKEDTSITRTAVNTLLEWADDASIQVIPLFRKPQRHVE